MYAKTLGEGSNAQETPALIKDNNYRGGSHARDARTVPAEKYLNSAAKEQSLKCYFNSLF